MKIFENLHAVFEKLGKNQNTGFAKLITQKSPRRVKFDQVKNNCFNVFPDATKPNRSQINGNSLNSLVKNKLKIYKGLKYVLALLKSGVKRNFKNGKNRLFSQAKNVSWYVRYHIKTSTHPKFGCFTRNLGKFCCDIANIAEAM